MKLEAATGGALSVLSVFLWILLNVLEHPIYRTPPDYCFCQMQS